jgi:hypothetical protein
MTMMMVVLVAVLLMMMMSATLTALVQLDGDRLQRQL